jgi:hypothetical protein
MATRNRYAEIMAQYAQMQPYSFFGYPQSYTGGFDVAQPQAYAAPATRYEQIMQQPARISRGGPETPEGPSAWDQLAPAERAAYYKEHPNWGDLMLKAQDIAGYTFVGGLAKAHNPDSWYNSRLEKMGVNPTISLDTQNQLAGEAMQKALYPTGGFVAVTPQQAAAEAAQAAAQVQADTSAAQASGGGGSFMGASAAPSEGGPPPSGDRGGSQTGGGYGGGAATGGNNGDASGGGDRGTRGGFAQGGHVSMMHLQGPNPMGPDDGYGALKDGEYVINDKAVKKYGIELMNAINSGKISKGKLRGLLEM